MLFSVLHFLTNRLLADAVRMIAFYRGHRRRISGALRLLIEAVRTFYMLCYNAYKGLGHHCKDKMPKIWNKIPRKGISGPHSQFPHSCVCERIIYSHDGSAFSAGGNMWTDPGNIQITHRHMNVEIGAEAAQFPEKEYINVIAVAVHAWMDYEYL